MPKVSIKTFLLLAIFALTASFSYGQRYLSDLDTSMFIRDTLRPFLKRFDNIHFSGYIQPQFQVAQGKGARSYAGGDFSQFSNSRFMLRRARIKLDYFTVTEDEYPKTLFTFQVDATERGVNVRDMFLRLYETKKHNFSLTMGIFARPFGFEVNLSSAYRETPERGRMSQILMPSERDLGAMVSYEPLKRGAKNHWFKVDAGIFNGQGLSGPVEFDSRKDIISRITIKPQKLSRLEVSGGFSLLQGGWRQETKYRYKHGADPAGNKIFVVDSSLDNIGSIAPRKYYGTDVQLKLKHGAGTTELRAEYWLGKQTGTELTTVNPGTLPTTAQYIRNFDGAFICFLQDIIDTRNQLLVKYDWYDPNTDVNATDIGKQGTNLTVADVRYSTLGFGFIHYFKDYVKAILYYDIVKNEKTQLAGSTADLKDNIFTFRIQYRF